MPRRARKGPRSERRRRVVDFFGIRRPVLLDVVDEPVQPGDYVLNHVGFAIRRIPPEQTEETLSLYEALLREAGDDIMAADVRGEIAAAERTKKDAPPRCGSRSSRPARASGALSAPDARPRLQLTSARRVVPKPGSDRSPSAAFHRRNRARAARR